MSDEQAYTDNLKMCWMLGQMASNIPTAEMLSAIGTADAIAPVVDPTLWMRGNRLLACDQKIVQAIHALARVFTEAKDERMAEEARLRRSPLGSGA